MGGFVGIYPVDGSAPVDVDVLVRQTDTLAHRGPGRGTVHAELGLGLGQRQLDSGDLPRERLPLWDSERRLIVALDGHLFNQRDLRAVLEQRGHRFHTDAEAEVIVHAYREWGEACAARFRGPFALALYDRKTRDLFLARDQIGRKPLYVYRDEKRLVFASELKAIVEDFSIARVLDPASLVDYFVYGYVPAPRSVFRGISKLSAGHLMVACGSRFAIRQYLDLDFSRPDETLEGPSSVERVLGELRDATRCRTTGASQLGVLLSGSPQSALVASLASEQLSEPISTFNIALTDGGGERARRARELAKRLGAEHIESSIDVEAEGMLEWLGNYHDEPLSDPASVASYLMSARAKQRVRVVLSGHGGDEGFGGESRCLLPLMAQQSGRRVPGFARRRLERSLEGLGQRAEYLPRSLRDRAVWAAASGSPERAYFLSMSSGGPERVLLPEFLVGVEGYDPFDHVGRLADQSNVQEPLARLQYVDLRLAVADDVLPRLDRGAMAHALDVRTPLLDHKVIELVAQLPSRLKYDRGEKNIVLRRAAASLLPGLGFGEELGPEHGPPLVPVSSWMRFALKQAVQNVLFGDLDGSSGLLCTRVLRRLWYEHQIGLCDHGRVIWRAFAFELWARRFLSHSSSWTSLPAGALPSELAPIV
jgi:asparagine synthase (glutamine-hydrolysing)